MIKSKFRSLVEAALKEVSYPSGFSLDIFSQLPTFKARVEYCNKYLNRLGQGSSRIVYQVDNKKVLKIAKNRKGIAQNEKEQDWGRNQYGVAAELLDGDTTNFTWNEMELAYKVNKHEVKSIIGITWEELCQVICYMHDEYSHDSQKILNKFNGDFSNIKKIMEEQVYTEKNEFLSRLYGFMSDYQPKYITDYCHIQNWGKVNRDGIIELVLIDDGFDEKVSELYK